MDTRELKCYTNKSDCCKFEPSGGEGEWLFPNGSIVRRASFSDDMYRNRGTRVINLKWKINSTIPTGFFCCKIPDTPVQRACIGVYPEDEGN